MSNPIPPPDWARYVMPASMPGNMPPVGDPVKWSGTGRVDFGGPQRESEQIIYAATKDAYARPWSLIGELTMPSSFWENMEPYAGDPPVIVLLEIVLGMGQIQLMQTILLAAGGKDGLCNQQSAINGGPYARDSRRMPGFPFSPFESRPFAAIGSLVANTIAIRMLVGVRVESEYNPAFISVIVGPMAAGTGL